MAARNEFLDGVKTSVPTLVAALPFGLLFGTLAIENGMTTGEAVLMSAMLFAGASQMVGIEMFGQDVTPWLIVLSIVAVNFRHVLYSAAAGRRIARWGFLAKAAGFFVLTDPQYAETERRAEAGKAISLAWYFGVAAPLYLLWVAETWVGAEFGKLIEDPASLGIDFLLPIYFLGLVMSFRKRPSWLPIVIASAIGSIVAYKTVGSPWHVTLGAVAGIVVAIVLPNRSKPAKADAHGTV